MNLGIHTYDIFPAVDVALKDKTATYSYAEENFYLHAIRTLKEHFPEIVIMTDVAMDPYSSDGHDGLVENGQILNDETLPILAKMAIAQAQAGSDIIGPSDMMDGRVGFLPKPSLYPDWLYYRVRINNVASSQVSVDYIFWNECVYGNCECIWPNVRLAWVGARGGYEYFNFKKKSEYTTEVDRKLYKRPLFNSSPTIFYANDRGLNQRTNLAQRILTVTSDYITQDEFIYLRGLIVSNQVHLINDDGTYIAVNIDDTSYVEKTSYDGKLYNVTLKVRMANEYWT
jgi:hypothetical protein